MELFALVFGLLCIFVIAVVFTTPFILFGVGLYFLIKYATPKGTKGKMNGRRI